MIRAIPSVFIGDTARITISREKKRLKGTW